MFVKQKPFTDVYRLHPIVRLEIGISTDVIVNTTVIFSLIEEGIDTKKY